MARLPLSLLTHIHSNSTLQAAVDTALFEDMQLTLAKAGKLTTRISFNSIDEATRDKITAEVMKMGAFW